MQPPIGIVRFLHIPQVVAFGVAGPADGGAGGYDIRDGESGGRMARDPGRELDLVAPLDGPEIADRTHFHRVAGLRGKSGQCERIGSCRNLGEIVV